MSTPPAPAAVTLVVGSEELLADRAVSAIVAAARAIDPDTDIRDVRAGDLTAAFLGELLSPSLFGERRVAVVRGLGMGGKVADDDAEDDDDAGDAPTGTLDQAALAELVAFAATKDAEAHVVLVHRDANRGRAQLNALRKAKATEVDCKPLKGRAITDFVSEEFKRTGRRIGNDVPAAVVAAVGKDLRELASACSQMAADCPPGQTVDRAVVDRFFAGRVEADAFSVADAVVEGRTPQALTLTRHALAVGVSAPAITAVVAIAFRNLVNAAAAPRGVSLEDAAKAVGMRDWQLRKARTQLTGWGPDGVARALRAVADADADVKGAAVDQAYALERMVIVIGRARAAR